MKTFTTKKSLQDYLEQTRSSAKIIGFVPTMGALHDGHLSLIRAAREYGGEIVCSIFVNPTQFNDPKDLENYPRPIAHDIEMLTQAHCDVLFNPGADQVYDDHKPWHLEIGELEHLLEGKFRPGHYQGVTQVVHRLFDIVKPDVAFFGQKDYQQYLVISKMVELLGMRVKLVMCPIERDPDGLAMSSRNIHLSPQERKHALILSKTLRWTKDHFDGGNIQQLRQQAQHMLAEQAGVEPEYFEIADGDSLHPASENSRSIIALVAARVGKTRLIDNLFLS